MLQPSEFWRMHPDELWWYIEARMPKKVYGNKSEAEVREIYEQTYGKGQQT